MGFLSFYYYLILKGETCLTTFPKWLKNRPEMYCGPNYAPVPKTLRLIPKSWEVSFRFVWGHEDEVLMMGKCFSAKEHQGVDSQPLLHSSFIFFPLHSPLHEDTVGEGSLIQIRQTALNRNWPCSYLDLSLEVLKNLRKQVCDIWGMCFMIYLWQYEQTD